MMTKGRRTWAWVGAVTVALSFVLATGMVAGAGSASADGPPYEDPNPIGSLTLCNEDLEPITEGSTLDRPFVWRAVSDTAAPAPYGNRGRRAVLYYFQPRENVNPLEWSSEILTGAATYEDPEAPIAQATPIDYPLASAVRNFPPRWDGYAQLRMYFTTEGVGQSADYASADIRVEGDTWTLVRGGDADCDAGKAVSIEKSLPDYDKRLRQAQNGTDLISKELGLKPDATSGDDGDGSTSPSGSDGTDDETPAALGASEAGSDPASDGGPWLWVALLVAALVLAGVGGAAFWMNRKS
jgi:hypothetical protein